MDYAYSVLMGCFSAAILIYAGLMALTKDYKMLPIRSRQSVKPKDPKRYMTQLSKVVALVALSPALSSLVGLCNTTVAFIVLIATMIIFIVIGTRFMKDVM